jgi:hypothetical protein
MALRVSLRSVLREAGALPVSCAPSSTWVLRKDAGRGIVAQIGADVQENPDLEMELFRKPA